MKKRPPSPAYVVALTGASGAIYGLRLVERLALLGRRVFLIVSRAGLLTIAAEVDLPDPPPSQDRPACLDDVLLRKLFPTLPARALGRLRWYAEDDFSAPPASGASSWAGMAIAPCSMKTLAAVRAGYASTLVTRAADVALKERRPLVLLPRETPLSPLHLENLLYLARLGAVILPPLPAFYRRPRTLADLVEATVDRALVHLGAVKRGPGGEWGARDED